MTSSVLLCDDEPHVGIEWAETVGTVVPQDHYTILPPPGRNDLHSAIKELFAREAAGLDGDGREPEPCVLDGADILILDYDLLHVDKDNARHTGEALARLARMFSDVAVIVIVNQFRGAQFDLSLRGHLSSHADLNLDVSLLGSSGLWRDPPWDGFRPWQWQTLYRAVETQRVRQAWAKEHMDAPIVDALGMREEDVDRLSDTAIGFIASNAEGWPTLRRRTFRQFAVESASGRREAKLVESDPHLACRFAAARLGKWLERHVLGPEEMLVDLPHLIQNFPFLLGADVSSLEAWNAVVYDDECVLAGVPDDCWFQPKGILSRPAIWRQRFEDEASVLERRRTFDFSSVPPFVFLEDTSTFGPLEEAKQFRAGHHNHFDRRFARCMDGIVYAPQRRFACWM